MPQWVGEMPIFCVTVVSRDLASSDNIVAKMSLAAVAILWGQYQESISVLQMLLLQVRVQPCPFVTLMITRALNSVVPYIIDLTLKLSTVSPCSEWVNLWSLIWVCQKLSMQCLTVLQVVPTTQLGSLSSLSLPRFDSSSSLSSSSTSLSLPKVGKLFRLSPKVFGLSLNDSSSH